MSLQDLTDKIYDLDKELAKLRLAKDGLSCRDPEWHMLDYDIRMTLALRVHTFQTLMNKRYPDGFKLITPEDMTLAS